MLVDSTSMDNNIIVVLANTAEEAIAHGKRMRPHDGVKIMPMHQRSEVYLLYGHRDMPFIIAPGTKVQEWHQELEHHFTVGRIKRLRNYKIVEAQPKR